MGAPAYPFHRARSASKKGTWPLPLHPSATARCASTGNHQGSITPLFREHRTSVDAPSLSSAYILRGQPG